MLVGDVEVGPLAGTSIGGVLDNKLRACTTRNVK
jgi:hypothetical protein